MAGRKKFGRRRGYSKAIPKDGDPAWGPISAPFLARIARLGGATNEDLFRLGAEEGVGMPTVTQALAWMENRGMTVWDGERWWLRTARNVTRELRAPTREGRKAW